MYRHFPHRILFTHQKKITTLTLNWFKTTHLMSFFNTQFITRNCHVLKLSSQNYIHTQKKFTTQLMTLNWFKMTPLFSIFVTHIFWLSIVMYWHFPHRIFFTHNFWHSIVMHWHFLQEFYSHSKKIYHTITDT